MEKQHEEQVLDKTSTHAIIKKVNDEIVYDLIIKNGDEVEVLATDRTFDNSIFNLTEEELSAL